MALERYAPQLSNCLLLGDSWEICTTAFKLLPSKWFSRYIRLNFQTAPFLNDSGDVYTATFTLLPLNGLEICAPLLLNCFLLNTTWDIYTATFKLLNDSRDICIATFKLLPFQWLLRNMHCNFHTASFLMTLEIYTPQLSNCFLFNDSWEICTTTFTLLPS